MFAYVARPEHLPRYGAPLWLTADAEARRPGAGEPPLTLRGYFAGLPVEGVVRTTSRAPHTLEITQVRGTLRAFSQRFTVENGDDGTLLFCRVEADPGIPMLSDEAAKHFLVQYVERMLDRLRLAADRRAPSRRLARPPRPGADVTAADADDTARIDSPADGAGEARQRAAEAPDESGRGEAVSPPPGIAEAPSTTAPAPSAGRRRFRPRPPARPQPPSPSAPAGAPTAVPAGGVAAGGEPSQSRRRRRRRRRRGRGTPGSGAAGGEPAAGSPPAGDG